MPLDLARDDRVCSPDPTAVEHAYDLAGKVQPVSDPTRTYSFAGAGTV